MLLFISLRRDLSQEVREEHAQLVRHRPEAARRRPTPAKEGEEHVGHEQTG